jgi:hypothetical protein
MYEPRLHEYFEILDRIAKSDGHPNQLAAVKVLLDQLICRPAVYVDAVHTQIDIKQEYLRALVAVNQRANNDAIDAEPVEPDDRRSHGVT